MTSTPVIGILGATGGLGASTLAVALSQHLSSPTRTTLCVDARPYSGGLDVTWAAEHLPGLRWADLSSIDDDPDTSATLRELPVVHEVTLISHTAGPQPPPAPPHAARLVAAIADTCDATIIDLPRLGETHHHHWWDLCTHLVVLLPSHPAGVAAALHLTREALPATSEILAIQRVTARHHLGQELASSLAIPYLTSLRDHPLTARRSAAGLIPVTPRSPYARCAARIAAAICASTEAEAA